MMMNTTVQWQQQCSGVTGVRASILRSAHSTLHGDGGVCGFSFSFSSLNAANPSQVLLNLVANVIIFFFFFFHWYPFECQSQYAQRLIER
jgi:hypothetical protein